MNVPFPLSLLIKRNPYQEGDKIETETGHRFTISHIDHHSDLLYLDGSFNWYYDIKNLVLYHRVRGKCADFRGYPRIDQRIAVSYCTCHKTKPKVIKRGQ